MTYYIWYFDNGITTIYSDKNTICSCCGHGRAEPTIGVRDEDIPKMKAMGYKVWNNPARPNDDDIFVAKTLCDRQEVLVEK